MTDFVQDFAPRMPMVDVAGALSPFLNRIPGAGGVAAGLGDRREPILTNAPRAQKSLENKYAGYFPQLAQQYDAHVVNAMIAMDTDRVTRGQSPLSEEETRRAMQTAQTGKSVTGEAKPSPFNFFGNAVRNIGDIVKSIPRIPSAILDEARDLSKIGEYVGKGKNPISGLASAPGIRMLPGAYLVENLAEGDIAELAANPVFTALDILPFANQLAKGTKVATAAREASEAIARGDAVATLKEARRLGQMERRPMAAALNNTLDADGNIVRTASGEFVDKISESRMMKPMRQWFSQTERDVMFTVNSAQQRVHNIVRGIQQPGDIATSGGQLDTIAREAVQLREKLVALDPDIEARIPDITDKMVSGRWDELTGVDAQAAEMYRATMQKATEWSVGNNYHVLFDGEIYDVPTGVRLKRGQATVDRVSRFNRTRQQMIAGTADAPTLLRDLQDLYGRERKDPTVGSRSAAQKLEDLNAQRVSETELNDARRMTLRTLEASGYDISHFKTVSKNKKGRTVEKLKTDDELLAAVRDVTTGRVELPKRNLLNMEQVLEVIRANKADYTGNSVALLEAGIAKGEWKVVTQALETLRKQKGSAALADEVFVDSIRQLRDTSRELSKTAKYSDEALKRLESAQARQKRMTPPARFLPEVDRLTRKTVTEQLIEAQDEFGIFADDALTAAQVIELADRGMWTEIPGWNEQFHRQIQRETVATWMDMKAKGFDPMFIHTVPSNRLSRVLHPGESIVPNKPSSTTARKWDLAPGFKDFTIAASDQMIEFLRRRETEVAVKQISDMVGESETVLRGQYIGAAEARYAKAPVKSVEQHLQDIINESWTKFDPEQMGYNWGTPYLNQLQQSDVMIPKSTAKNLHALSDPKQIAGGLFDPFTKTFRIATVGLSLRTQIYNVIGGAISQELRAPGSLLRQMDRMKQFREATKTGDFSAIPRELQEIVGSQKATLLQLDDAAQGKVLGGVGNYLVGKKMREWWDAHQAAKVPGRPIERFKGKFTGLTEKLYDFNAFFDDSYRVASYWDEYDRAVKKGANHEAAAAKAVGESRRVLQDWMGMTPMERSVMKSLVPFYGFMSHAMRFVMQYPLDHPLRAEFMSKIAEAELEDMNGLPKRFLASLFIGKMGDDGKQNALNLASLNPFGDVANMMTVSGFLGATNPVLQTMFQMVGLDQGKADLYPSLRYDATTGRLSAKSANPLMALLDNTIPQSGLVTAMLGMNSQFNEQLLRDPAAAQRFLLSSMTAPIIWREWNVPQEQFKAELARMDAETKVKNEALRTGDWSEALRYPNLAQYLAVLDAMPPDQLSAFAMKEKGDVRGIADAAFGGRPVGLPSVSPLDDQVYAALRVGPSLVSGGMLLGGQQPAGVRGAQPPAVQPGNSIAGAVSSAGNI